jgi:hypothetical protein
MKFYYASLLKHKRKLDAVITVALLLTAIIYMVLGSLHTSKNTSRLDEQKLLQAEYQQLENNLNSISNTVVPVKDTLDQHFATLTNQVNQLQTNLVTLQNQNNLLPLQTAIKAQGEQTTQQLTYLQTQIQQIKKQVTPIYYRSAKALPFHVVSVDIWNGQPELTISIHGQSDLMALGDVHSGWQLVCLQFNPPLAIFKNRENQLVKITH